MKGESIEYIGKLVHILFLIDTYIVAFLLSLSKSIQRADKENWEK